MASSDPGHIGGPVVIPGCIQVALVWDTAFGHPALNILHGSVLGGFTPTVAVANTLHAALSGSGTYTTLKAFFTDESAFRGVRLLDMRSPGNPPVDSTVPAVPGTSVAANMAPGTALVVTERTARAGPGFRGRIYVPGWASNASDTGAKASAAATAALSDWAGTFIAAFAASGLTLAIAQPARAAYTGRTGTAHPARAAATQAVTALVVRNSFWDSQRRRGEPS